MRLLKQTGIALVVTGRNQAKLNYFEHQATVVPGDLENVNTLKEILNNTTAIFMVLPQLRNTTIEDYANILTRIAEDSGVSHLVNISNCTLTRWGKPTQLLEFESSLNEAATTLNIKHLRCANFFENLNWGLNTPYRGDIKLPYISSFEIADIAASYLKALSFKGVSVDELMGNQDYSMTDFADKLDVEYRQTEISEDDASFFNAFNENQYTLVSRNEQNTSASTNEAFTLEYFLNHHFDRSLLD